MNQSLENTLSVHRPAWTHDDLQAYNHLHLPVHQDGETLSIRKNHFLRTEGFATMQDRRNLE